MRTEHIGNATLCLGAMEGNVVIDQCGFGGGTYIKQFVIVVHINTLA
jgi:hypothetical protein